MADEDGDGLELKRSKRIPDTTMADGFAEIVGYSIAEIHREGERVVGAFLAVLGSGTSTTTALLGPPHAPPEIELLLLEDVKQALEVKMDALRAQCREPREG